MVTGLREALAMLGLARAEGLRAIVTTTFDSGVGTMLAAHLAALLPEPRPACGLSTLEYLDVISSPACRASNPGCCVFRDPRRRRYGRRVRIRQCQRRPTRGRAAVSILAPIGSHTAPLPCRPMLP